MVSGYGCRSGFRRKCDAYYDRLHWRGILILLLQKQNRTLVDLQELFLNLVNKMLTKINVINLIDTGYELLYLKMILLLIGI